MDILNQFGINPLLLTAQVVNFLVLLWILNKFLYKPIIKALEERKRKIAESLENAEEIERRLLEINEEKEARIREATLEGEKIIQQATATGSQILEDVRKKSQEIIQKAHVDAKQLLEIERANLNQQIRENLAEIISISFQKVTGKTLSQKEREDILEKEIKNIS